ncbi:MAG: nucleotidyltransferase family protein [Bdellovibrionales bacterium]
MKFGLTEEQFVYIFDTVVKPLKDSGAEVYCFGSRASCTHQKFSDLDLMVESSNDLSNIIGLIQEQLSNSNFPYKVDLVQFRDFAESYKENYQNNKTLF